MKFKRNKPEPKPLIDETTGEPIEVGADGLYPRQRRFCEEYIKDYSPGEAMVRAGFKNHSSIRQSAFHLLNNPHVQAYIRKLMDDITERTKVDVTYIVQKTHKIVEACAPEDETGKIIRDKLKERGALAGLSLLSGHTGGFDKNNPKALPQPNINIFNIDSRQKARKLIENIRKLRPVKPISIE